MLEFFWLFFIALLVSGAVLQVNNSVKYDDDKSIHICGQFHPSVTLSSFQGEGGRGWK